MIKYQELNVNPKHRKTGDCSTRALVSVLGLDYDTCLKLQTEESLKCYYDPTSKEVMQRILEKYGWIKCKQPRKTDGSKYTVAELDKILSKEDRDNGVLVTVAGHHTAIIGDNCLDIWDCRFKAIGNYYIKIKGENNNG